ncbi:Fructose-bisphosphate aldolase class 1 [Propionibacterium australiense]|uniref:fructose-bisphosphate aldolase n=1 Tax=Propionibacterium australiense TaxID=119981 RepID=A0A383S6H9_9ACTN|nr:fructose bisphosphate aldolase [Propionibacterium australiense]RLP08548.1 fructose bisphosphate aldolase [Propionibacterium australiense]RLP08615.1 fructose bisphosphate aldolase [Propionibacterium australiense]SYZ33600.1 fructose-bisphosphate aldolase [Propionibacterium australiense]VEH88793.1 Fructose-bisphosphate aldolase class 1 [Propionibacterium australiense]
MNTQQQERMGSGKGFIAALDQSGGSTPRALRLYGIGEDAWSTEEEMFDLVHQMRTRIMTSPSFTSEHILAAILFERTMENSVESLPTAQYLWERKGIVPILKVDKGLLEEADGVRLMKPMPALDELLDRAVANGIFGTKMRSVIAGCNEAGIKAIVAQQYEIAQQILAKGLVPIIEPETDIHAEDREAAEEILHAELKAHLDDLPEGQQVMFKLTIPVRDNLYADLIADPRVLRVVALSGGFTRQEACERLARNTGMSASFSRALTEGLSVNDTQEEFDAKLRASIEEIAAASAT